MKSIIIVAFILSITACESMTSKPNNTIDALSVAINEASRTIDMLEKQGVIDSEDESSAQRKLAYAHSLLLNPTAPIVGGGICATGEDRITCAETILQSALELLPRESK